MTMTTATALVKFSLLEDWWEQFAGSQEADRLWLLDSLRNSSFRLPVSKNQKVRTFLDVAKRFGPWNREQAGTMAVASTALHHGLEECWSFRRNSQDPTVSSDVLADILGFLAGGVIPPEVYYRHPLCVSASEFLSCYRSHSAFFDPNGMGKKMSTMWYLAVRNTGRFGLLEELRSDDELNELIPILKSEQGQTPLLDLMSSRQPHRRALGNALSRLLSKRGDLDLVQIPEPVQVLRPTLLKLRRLNGSPNGASSEKQALTLSVAARLAGFKVEMDRLGDEKLISHVPEELTRIAARLKELRHAVAFLEYFMATMN